MFALYVLTGGLLGFSYDLIHQQFIKARLRKPLCSQAALPRLATRRLAGFARQVTSSMSMGIAGNTKMVLLIAISMVRRHAQGQWPCVYHYRWRASQRP